MKLRCAVSQRLRLNGVKGGVNSLEHHESWSAHLSIKWASKSMIKFQFREIGLSENFSCSFAKVGLKGGENNLEHREIWHAHLSIKWASKSMFKFQFEEISVFLLGLGLKEV